MPVCTHGRRRTQFRRNFLGGFSDERAPAAIPARAFPHGLAWILVEFRIELTDKCSGLRVPSRDTGFRILTSTRVSE
jgi:hypothetical protein